MTQQLVAHVAAALVVFTAWGEPAFAKDHKGTAHRKGKHQITRVHVDSRDGALSRRDRQLLPPGLAKRDRLPPGLAKQRRERGRLPPGLQKRLVPQPRPLWLKRPATRQRAE